MKNQYDDNLITDSGNYDPYVFADTDGIHIGDCDNNEIFETIAEAIAYAKQARLRGERLSKCRSHAVNDLRDNMAAEYRWQQDAGLQLDALRYL
jgi:hypothetical protein